MMANIDNLILVFSIFISGTLVLIGGILTFYYALKRNNRLVYLFSANWFFQAICWYLISAAHYFYFILLMPIAFIFQCIGVIFIFIFIELVKKERVSTLKVSILVLIETLYLFIIFLPGAMEIIPGYGIHVIGFARVFQIIFLIYYVFFYFSWSLKTLRKAPPELKRLSTILVIGSILFSIVSVFFYTLGTFIRLFNALGFIIHSIGALITVIIIWREPKIIYILPFKAYRIFVFESKSGINLFTYKWSELKSLQEDFFSAMIQAIGHFLTETLHKGFMREIHLEQAILIIKHDSNYPIASVIVATKSSKSLKYSLNLFNNQFISNYSKYFDNYYNTSRFDGAQKLVNKIFEYVPEDKQ